MSKAETILSSIVSTVGAIAITILALKLVGFLRKFFVRESYDHGLRYGQHTWALITAPTSTTGSGFALQLAKRGFHIVLVGRDIEKMHRLRDLIVLKHMVKVRTIVADFRKAFSLPFYNDILRQVEDLDVSIVVNAVGCAGLSEKFHQMSAEKIRECLVVNTFGCVLLCQQFLPRLVQRFHRSAIINISSEIAHQAIPGMAVSSGSKAFITQFTMAAAYEYRDKIDIMATQPLAVKKKRTDGEEGRNLIIIDSEAFASACLRQLGHTSTTSGHWIHALQSGFFWIWPNEWKLAVWEKFIMPKHFEMIKEPRLVSASTLQ
uniref:very-long-chain 3-oxoacyl-CoA reductase 1-like n=1 Tax=Styela clava TaxID=7725 RepID=UPI00193A40B1|nr:very-long-chain 3-oxoacyl-CoA reductase 1-like [Styela clava]